MGETDELQTADPRGLIRESYVIDGIAEAECRSIFLDWFLGVPVEADGKVLIRRLLGHYGQTAPKHPMTKVLQAGLKETPPSRRRGGAKGRHASRSAG